MPAPKLKPRDIQAFMKRHGLSQSETARRAGLSRQTLINYLHGKLDTADPLRVRQLAAFMKRVDRRKGGAG